MGDFEHVTHALGVNRRDCNDVHAVLAHAFLVIAHPASLQTEEPLMKRSLGMLSVALEYRRLDVMLKDDCTLDVGDMNATGNKITNDGVKPLRSLEFSYFSKKFR